MTPSDADATRDPLAMPTAAELADLLPPSDAENAETRWTLTPAGASYLAGEATSAYLDDATVEAAVRMETLYSLAERLAQLDEWGAQ